jgi:16S rRNA (guanine966-N2)-methyltransferase
LNTGRKKPPKVALGAHKLRVIAGKWRSRTVEFPLLEGLRPTGDRIRETLFNWLAPRLPECHCLDLFAGSGILGFEALSRGAATCTFVEIHPVALELLQRNSARLNAVNASIEVGDALKFLSGAPRKKWDVVFIDPPFALNLWSMVIQKLDAGWLNEGAFIYLETPKDHPVPLPEHWHLFRQKHAGQVSYCLYEYKTNAELSV